MKKPLRGTMVICVTICCLIDLRVSALFFIAVFAIKFTEAVTNQPDSKALTELKADVSVSRAKSGSPVIWSAIIPNQP